MTRPELFLPKLLRSRFPAKRTPLSRAVCEKYVFFTLVLETTSTWVSRHWAAAADAASREPLLVKNHKRQRVVVLHEELARDFLVWYAAQEGRVADPIGAAAAELEAERQQEEDERSVRSLRSKWGVLSMPRAAGRRESVQQAILSIQLGSMPADRDALHELVEEFRERPESDWFIATERQRERERKPGLWRASASADVFESPVASDQDRPRGPWGWDDESDEPGDPDDPGG